MSERRSFFAELKRRNVLRAGALYIGAAWALSQGVAQLLPVFDFPNWVVRWIVIAAIIGFPFAMLFSWFYEWTPHGIQRESEVAQDASVARQTGKTLDRWIIAVLSLAVVLLLANTFVLHKDANTATTTRVPGKSIAVLPFESLSEDKDNAYFATGMQDEILTRLASIHDLKVISRTSTEQYASHPPNLRIVAEQLGVATVLEGSVQKANGKVRINLQLIDARSDSHLWAHNYDRDLKDVFAVQTDVAEQVADALKAQLLPAESTRIASVPTKNPEAYDRFLKAQDFFNQLDATSSKDPAATERKAESSYREAIALDPDFALAYARLSFLKSFAYWYGIDPSAQTIDEAQTSAQHALALQPGLPEAHLAMGYAYYYGHRDYAAALNEFSTARASLPNNANVIAAIGYVHRRQGHLAQCISELQQAEVLDPLDPSLPREIGNSLMELRRYDEANAAYKRSLALLPTSIEALVGRATTLMMSGDTNAAERALAEIPAEDDPQGSVSLARFTLAMRLRQPDAALAAIAHAPAWITSRFEHARLPGTLLQGQALTMKGQAGAAHAAFLQAREALQDLAREPGNQAGANSYLALAYAGLGEKAAAIQAARDASELLPVSADLIVGGYYLTRRATVEASVGETQSALQHLEQLMASPAGMAVSVSSLRLDPAWDPLRKDPRFQKLLAEHPNHDQAAHP